MDTSKQKKVLIIEDNPVFIKMLAMRMEASGYIVVKAEDGLTGLNAAKAESPDIILLDLMLPVMDGHKVCRFLKADRNLQNIPIAILTSRDLYDDAELAEKSGADAFIPKATKPVIILDVIQKLLDKAAVNNN
ncbi:hypothetical protein BVY01_03575 [bacterium I07]|nr:hypothetical protein BVY01_03575 [bacterium I07]